MATRFNTSPDGTRIAYDVTGAGPFLMLLHGAGKDRRDWHRLGYVDRLKGEFTVITVDFRGSGESEFLINISDYGIEKICADLLAVADACNAGQFAVWGYSFGGNIARYLGAWSDRLRAIAVIGVPFGPAVDEQFDQFIDDFVKKWGGLAEAYKSGQLSGAKHQSAIKGRIPVWVACFQAMRAWPAIDPDAIRCPALLLVGTHNTSTLKWVTSHRAELEQANVCLEIVEGLNHPQEFTRVEQVFPAVSEFLGGHSKQTGNCR
jgi:pimeloyl-ACP methyl ester carboxylesterase